MKRVTELLTSTSMNCGLGWLPRQSNNIEASPLHYILKEIQSALEAELYYAAVSISLSLPDICSALEIQYGHSRFSKVERRYTAWCNQYLESKFSSLKAADIWALRGGLIHNAMLSKHPKNERGRILLMPPNPQQIVIHEMEVCDGAPEGEHGVQVYLPFFCENMIAAVTEWWEAKRQDPLVQRNLPDLVRYRPDGLAPFMVGLPVIA